MQFAEGCAISRQPSLPFSVRLEFIVMQLHPMLSQKKRIHLRGRCFTASLLLVVVALPSAALAGGAQSTGNSSFRPPRSSSTKSQRNRVTRSVSTRGQRRSKSPRANRDVSRMDHACRLGRNGSEKGAIRTQAIGGHSWSATKYTKAATLYAGHGNGSERASMRTIAAGGSSWGATTEQKAAVMARQYKEGRLRGDKRDALGTTLIGGHSWGADDAVKLAAELIKQERRSSSDKPSRSRYRY